jgi:hypothetical protein
MFELDHHCLERLTSSNAFDLGDAPCVLFGLRGCLPVEEQDLTPLSRETFEPCALDWFHPRCALGIWDRTKGLLAATAGSTVPNRNAVEGSLRAWRERRRESANQLVPSLVAFTKGPHMISQPAKSYAAFRQHGEFGLQRTRDDLDYDVEDEIIVDVVGDNLHAAFVESSKAPTQKGIGSNGCQVVIGFAKRKGGDGEDRGIWPRYRDMAYASDQEEFPYFLLDSADAQRAAVAAEGTIPLRLRYGSSGPIVEKLQGRLTRLGLLGDDEEGVFRKHTLLAVVGFQKDQGLMADGVVGPNTAEALGIAEDWPRF